MVRRLSFIAAVAGLILGLSTPPAFALEPAPTLSATGSTQTQVGLTWTAVSGAYSYEIQFATRQDFVGAVKTYKQGTSTLVNGLKPGTYYNFRVRAITQNLTAHSDWSNRVVMATKKLLNITVGSYNIKNPSSTAEGSWTTRGPRSASVVVGQGIKLLGAQELYQEDGRVQFLNWINQYAGGPHYAMAPAASSDVGYDNRIIYDKRSLQLLSSGGVKYASQVAGEVSRWMVWGKFKHLASGQYILFTTTHLSPESDTAVVRQWNQLIDIVAGALRGSSLPLKPIVTGDFNTTKFETPARTQLSKMRSYGLEDVLGQIYSSYTTYRNPGTRVDAWISTSNKGERDLKNGCRCIVSPDRNANSIDYVFVPKYLKVPFYRNYAQPRTGYVMNYLMSDHFMVKATVTQ